MTSENSAATPDWPRPYWTPGDEEPAILLFFVFGEFPAEIRIPASTYGSRGLPDGVELFRYPHATLKTWEGYPLAGALGDVLREDSAETFAAAAAAPEVLAVRGRVVDQPSLDYLRDTLGVLAGLLDLGGVAVVDPQILSLFDDAGWRRRFLVKGGAPPRNHTLILCTDADDGSSWVRTRGMRKFARPDISIRGVPRAQSGRAGALCEHLVELQALGAHLADGQVLEVEGLPDGLGVTRGGSFDDPLFNNTHVAVRWPAQR
ncbi:MAG TPA: hypothetical protein VFJ04_06755 [Rhodanobacteraceae bacterium]|nr:hypothetical protein [Rhodanobacteraceae bacterium]